MKDTDLYSRILGLSDPWFVADVELDPAGGRVRKSDLAPMRKVGEMLSRHLDNILTFCRHRITNGAAEGLNSKIMAIKRRACGYRNRDTSRLPSTSSAAAWTSIPRMPERRYPRKTRKDLIG